MSDNHYIVLSRKYRPKDLKDLIVQEILATSLRNSIDNKKVPHAFLFYGIRGVGKTTIARILSRCLNCVGADGKTDMTSSPCGVCRSCVAMDRDQHMDVMEFDAASRTSVDDIREIIDATQYMPVLGRYKIFIIDEVHMLSKSAFNALLKTLEEPPAHVKFIFATTEMHKIPETILSRCMAFQLKPVLLESLANHIISISQKETFMISKDAADIIAEESEGSVRDALSLLEQAMMLAIDKNISSDLIINMIGGAKSGDINSLLKLILDAKVEEALLMSMKLLENGSDPVVLYKNLQTELYKIITDKVLKRSNITYTLSNLLYLWQIFLKQSESMKVTQYPDHVLNATIVILAHTASFPDIGELMIGDENAKSENENISLSKKQSSLINKVEDIIGKKVEIKEDSSKKVIQDVLNRFPGSVMNEIE